MKKRVFIPLLFAAGALVVGAIPALSTFKAVSADGTTDANYYMPFNESNFTKDGDYGYDRLGVVRAYDFTSWSGRFNALDSFFSGEGEPDGRVEGRTGYFDSVTWHQKKDNPYVYFTLGANENNYVEVIRKDGGTVLGSTNNDQFNGNPMVMNYIAIDTTGLTENEEVFLRIHDNSTTSYGFVTFGYLHVNATAKNVSDAIWAHINSLTTHYDAGNNEVHYRIRETMNYYLNGKASTDGILLLSDNKNLSADEDFEDNTVFLNHWYRDTTYDHIFWWQDDHDEHRDNINDHYDKGWDSIICNGSQHNHQRMPFNKTGNGFFKGYREAPYGTDVVTGFMNTDNSKYRFISKPFVLSGTGFISIKMSGHPASLHVLRGNTELAFIDNKTNSRTGEQSDIRTGYNCLTMVRHVINLSEFKGQVIQLAFADVNCNGDYGAVNYDELITKYDTNPSFKVDTVTQRDDNPYYYKDFYVPMTNSNYGVGVDYKVDDDHDVTSDDSPVYEAYTFLKNNYYSTMRAPDGFAYPAANTDAARGVVNAYLALSSQAQSIVRASSDILSYTSTSTPISTAFDTLLGGYTQCTISFNANGGTGSMSTVTYVNGTAIPSCGFTAPEGQKFVEWNTQDDGEGASYNPGDAVPSEETLVLYAIWEDTAKTKVEALDTRTTLSYAYTDNGDGTFSYSNVKIRFGGVIAKSVWEELNEESEIQGYGVMVSLASSTAGYIGSSTFEGEYADKLATAGNVDDAITSLCDGTKIINFYNNAATSMPYENVSEQAYSWNLVQNVNSPNFFNIKYVAVAYIKISDGIVFLNESRVSAKSLAQSMMASGAYDVNSLGGSLNYLANVL